jgi:hypothetical protein
VPPTTAVRTFIGFAFPVRQVKSWFAFSDVDRPWRASTFILCCGRKGPNGQKGRQHDAGKSNSARVRHQCSHLFPLAVFVWPVYWCDELFDCSRDIVGRDTSRSTRGGVGIAPWRRDIIPSAGEEEDTMKAPAREKSVFEMMLTESA